MHLNSHSSPGQDPSEDCEGKLTIKQRLQKFELTELAWDLIMTGSTASLSGNNIRQTNRRLYKLSQFDMLYVLLLLEKVIF